MIDSRLDFKHLVRGAVLANRLRITALVSLAMVNVCALGAGVAVARLLPGRLALWNIPRVAAAPLVAGGQVLRPAQSAGPLPTSHGLSAALAPILASRALGSHVAAVVTDPVSGAVLFSSGGSSPAEPASTAKLATGVAALAALGPGARFTTRVVAGAAAGSVVLVGGGDPTLTAGPPPASDYPQPATLASLAAATARSLRAQGLTRVRLSYDTSLFSGPLLAPAWPTGYVSTGNVTPITSLEVDQGRLTPSGRPEDADNPGNFRPRSFDPAAVAATAFGSFLKADGIIVTGPVAQGTAPAGAATIAAVTRVLRGLDVSGILLVDGSGLSPDDRVTPSALTGLVAVAAGAGHAQLRPAVTGMPVAGFSGTLAPDQSVFGHFTGPALGAVRAKTGNLDTVATMAGLAYDRQGQVLAFAFMADQVPPGSLTQAAAEIDAMATLLAGCGCR